MEARELGCLSREMAEGGQTKARAARAEDAVALEVALQDGAGRESDGR